MPTTKNLKAGLSTNNSIQPIHSVSTKENYKPNDDELLFFAYVILRTIRSLKNCIYTDFDAHTTSTCCHGIAISVRDLILDACKLDLDNLENVYKNLIKHSEAFTKEGFFYAPKTLVVLARYYICTFIKEERSHRAITVTKKLKNIYEISTNFCNRIAHESQKYISNTTANSYNHHLQSLDPNMQINTLPVSLWGKYVAPEFLRQDKRSVEYAPCLFSMQISLAYLIKSRSKIALICHSISENNEYIDHSCYLFQGDGINTFHKVSAYDIALSSPSKYEPLVIFGGCAKLSHTKIQKHKKALSKWSSSPTALILSCDTHYPQFPPVSDDPEFNATPIIPDETNLKLIIDKNKAIKGTSLEDPSLFCLTHIYPASLSQVLNHISGSSALPQFNLPPSKQ